MSRFPDETSAGDPVLETRSGPALRIRVTARSARAAVTGVSTGALKVSVRAPAERGRATEEALRVLAAWLGLPRSVLRLAAGAASRDKRVLVSVETGPGLRKRIAGRLGGSGQNPS